LRKASIFLVVSLVLGLRLPFAMAGNSGDRSSVFASDARARARMKESAQFLGGAQRFSLEATAVHDYMTADGDVLESGSFRTITVRRPDRLRVDLVRRSGETIQLAANSKTITVMRARDSAYTQLESPKDLDRIVDQLIAKLGTRPPLANLLYSDLWEIMELRIDSATYVGQATVEGVDCDHLLFSNPDVDWQIWIEQGKRPLPRRLLVRYKNAPKAPTFRASIHRWDLQPGVGDEVFEIEPPKGGIQLPLSELYPKDR
jgi:hypothetical protein